VYLADGHLAAFRILGAGPDLGDMMARYLEFHRGRGNDPSIGVRLARLLESAGLHVISFHGAYGIMTVPPGIRPPAWAARQRMLTDRIIDHGMLRRRETRPQPARHIPVRPTIFARSSSPSASGPPEPSSPADATSRSGIQNGVICARRTA
jgi:hypothetical protein